MAEDNQRQHARLTHGAKINLWLSNGDQTTVNMRDFSQSGIFLRIKKDIPVFEGDIVSVQTLEFEDAPVQQAQVVRVEPGIGFAVEFI